MARQVLRYEVPVDDRWHPLQITGAVCHVGSRKTGVVEFWTSPDALRRASSNGNGEILSARYEDTNEKARTAWFRVFGTGHYVDGLWCGTTRDFATDQLIWHLFVRETEPTS